MSHRRLVATAAAVAAGIALVPGLAHAADPAPTTRDVHAAHAEPLPSTAFQTFSSPAEHTRRVQTAAAPKAAPVTGRQAQATGRTIYAYTYSCSSPVGDGTQASPFCGLQPAVDAASPGDTIQVTGYSGYSSWESVTVRTSGLTIVGGTGQPWVMATNQFSGKPALILDGVSDVTVSHLFLESTGSAAVQITGSSRITLDSNWVSAGSAGDALTIDGASSDVTVSRTYVDGNNSSTGVAVAVAPGAKRITLASDLLAASGVRAVGVQGLNVTGNTIQRGCKPAVDLSGTSSEVFVENNLIEDANPSTATWVGGSKAKCAEKGYGWSQDVLVAADSTAGTTSDYNAFYVYGDDATTLYNWGGTDYPALDGFRTATGQGAHDLIDTKRAVPALLGPWQFATIDLAPAAGSAVIGSANPAAPGALASDFYGTAPYTDRGAVQYLSTNPGMAISLTAKNVTAYGVNLAVSVKTVAVPQTVVIDWGDGTSDQQGFNGATPVTLSPTHHYKKPGKYTISVTDGDTRGNTVANSVQIETAGSEFTPYGPVRLLDTRDGTGAPRGKVPAYGTARVKITGNGGIPAGVTAVALNVTVTNTTSDGHVTAYPEDSARPTTSNLNYRTGQTVPNLVIVPVGPSGYVDLYNGGWNTVDLVADVNGYFTKTDAAGYTPVDPLRLVDTRSGTGTAKGQVAGRTSFPVQIAGAGGRVPASGVTAVALNVTVTNPRESGHLTVYPSGKDLPTASNLNFAAGQTVANAVVVPVGADGKVRVFNGGWQPTDVIVDVVGYYSADSASAYLPVKPTRLLDTRTSDWGYGPLEGGGYVYMPLGAEDPDNTAFVLNATVTNTRDAGHLTVAPDPNSLWSYQNNYASWPTPPAVSTLNWQRGDTVPNLLQAPAGRYGIVDLWNISGGDTDLIVDVFGFYEND